MKFFGLLLCRLGFHKGRLVTHRSSCRDTLSGYSVLDASGRNIEVDT